VIWNILLLAVSVPGPETSYLVDGERDHEWHQFSDEEKGSAWIDLNWQDMISHDSVRYPSILVRFQFKAPSSPVTIGDNLFAVDCEKKVMAVIDGWAEDRATGELFSYPRGQPPLFDFATEPFDDNEVFLYKHACGPNWTP
jgi:hypothetical protein